ncbi:MAG TPA: TniQ family protein [Gaiellaceae bacterium]
MNSPVRTLPVRPRHIDGEAFGSYVERLARDLNLPLASLLKLTEFVAEDSFRSLPVGFGIASVDRPLEALAAATRHSDAEIQRMLLTHYSSVALDLSDLDPAVPDSFRRVALREWAYFSSTHICPLCVAEDDGALLLRWRLPWSFACTKHEVLLVDTCTKCGHRTGSGRRDGRMAPAFITHIPKPGFCANPMPTGFAYAGRSAIPCGFPLAELATESVRSAADVITAQSQLDLFLDSEVQPTVGGETVNTLSYFNDLRSVVAVLLHTATRADLGSLHGSRATAWSRCEHQRREVTEARAAARARGEGRSGPRLRLYTAVPTSAALLSAVVPTAMRILAAPSSITLAERFAWVTERAREIDSGLVHRLDKAVKFSAPLQTAWQSAVKAGGGFSTRAGLRGTNDSGHTFGAKHVPQLLWMDIYEREFAHLFPKNHPDYARRFCSVALVKFATGFTWKAAGASLELDGAAAANQANYLILSLSKNGLSEDLGERLLQIAEFLDKNPGQRIDYEARRRAFAEFVVIDDLCWQQICDASSINVATLARRRWASVWVSSELTGNDFRLHTAMQGANAESCREMYRRFVARDLPHLHDALTAHAANLLERPSPAA